MVKDNNSNDEVTVEETFDVKTPKVRFDLGFTVAVVAIVGLLFGIGYLSEQARNGGTDSSDTASSSEIVSSDKAVASLTDALLQSKHEAETKGLVEIYSSTDGKAVGVVIYDPNTNKDKVIISDLATGQYQIDSPQSGGLIIFNLANSIDTLKDFNVKVSDKGLYTIQPKNDKSNQCSGVTVEKGVVVLVAMLECSSGNLFKEGYVTAFEYGISGQARDTYIAGLAQGQDITGKQQ